MKNLQGLLAFVETATSGSLTAAAERLEITPAGVSKSLAKLEQQLWFPQTRSLNSELPQIRRAWVCRTRWILKNGLASSNP